MPRKLTLILGGSRSGKSSHAEKLAAQSGQSVLYVATAEANDDEMRRRIAAHRAQRPASWPTLEAPLRTGAAIAAFKPAAPPPPAVVLIDCITLLASNALAPLREPFVLSEAEALIDVEIHGLLSAWRGSEQHWIMVSNETGMGLIPPYPLGRAFRDALGRANQALAAAANEVLFMMAGLPLKLK